MVEIVYLTIIYLAGGISHVPMTSMEACRQAESALVTPLVESSECFTISMNVAYLYSIPVSDGVMYPDQRIPVARPFERLRLPVPRPKR